MTRSQLNTSLEQATLIKRYKRFLADIELPNGEVKTIHCPNTGAMTGCAEPGFTVYFSTSDNAKRKYPNTFELAQNRYGDFIGINTIRANQLAADAIKNGIVPELSKYSNIQTEVKYGQENSRIDILLTDDALPDCYIEVKSTTLLLEQESGLGAFPDAVTTRGQKHIRELMQIVEEGKRAILLFLVQHTGIKKVTISKHIDPQYADLLEKASQQGVEILVMHTHIDTVKSYVTHTSQFSFDFYDKN